MVAAVALTPFAEWLQAELRARGWNMSQLAAFAEIPYPTVYSWFNDGRRPGPDNCNRLAGALHMPETEVLIRAGRLSREPAEPGASLPGWLTQVLEQLNLEELRVVDATAHGLLRVREEREQYGAPEPPGQEEPSA